MKGRGVQSPVLNMKPKVAGEVLAYCTKCRMDLMHVVVSMEGDAVAKTQCKSCGGVHLYRAPKGGSPGSGTRKVLNRRKHPVSSARNHSGSPVAHDTKKWKDLVSAHDRETPRAYRMQECFEEGEFILHSVFGPGVVVHVPAPEKMTVHFEAGIKLLAQAR